MSWSLRLQHQSHNINVTVRIYCMYMGWSGVVLATPRVDSLREVEQRSDTGFVCKS